MQSDLQRSADTPAPTSREGPAQSRPQQPRPRSDALGKLVYFISFPVAHLRVLLEQICGAGERGGKAPKRFVKRPGGPTAAFGCRKLRVEASPAPSVLRWVIPKPPTRSHLWRFSSTCRGPCGVEKDTENEAAVAKLPSDRSEAGSWGTTLQGQILPCSSPFE